jgi:hypothetical protein
MALGEDLDVTGRWVLQLFYHGNTGGFLLLPLEGGKWDTSRPPTTPTVELPNIIENREDIQPIRKKEKIKKIRF